MFIFSLLFAACQTDEPVACEVTDGCLQTRKDLCVAREDFVSSASFKNCDEIGYPVACDGVTDEDGLTVDWYVAEDGECPAVE